MARVKRSYTATETVVYWILGTRPNGKYLPAGGQDPLTSDREAAKPFLTENPQRRHLR